MDLTDFGLKILLAIRGAFKQFEKVKQKFYGEQLTHRH